MRDRAGMILAAACLLAVPASAEATTYCYPNVQACPGGTGTLSFSVESSAQSAARSDGTPDTIYLGANSTYTDTGSLDIQGTDDLTIQGAGTTSVLTTSSNSNIYVVNAAASSGVITFKDLRIVAPASLNGGSAMQIDGDVLDGVDIEIQHNFTSGVGNAIDTNTIRNTHIYATGAGALSYAVDASDSGGGGSLLIEDTRIDQPSIGVVADAPNTPVDVRRTTITSPAQIGFSASGGGHLTVANSLVRITSAATALAATGNSAGNSVLDADHVTVVKTAGNVSAVQALVVNPSTGSATANVTNSILRGYTSTWLRNAPVGAGTGDANISISWSDFVDAGTNQGDGTTTIGTGNIDADPLFAGASDFHLTAGSPALDAGNPVGTSALDLDSAARVVDGNGDCAARRDMGAYELQTAACQPPALSGTAGALAVVRDAAPAAVDSGVALTDPDPGPMASAVVTLVHGQPGDALGYQTAGGVTGVVGAAQDTVTFTGPTARAALETALRAVTFASTSQDTTTERSVTFRVNDGNADSNVLTRAVTVSAPPAVDPGGGGTPGGGGGPGGGAVTPDTTAPVISGLARRSGRLRFALSESASVTWRLAVRRPGRLVGKRCVAPTAKNRGRRACRRWVSRTPVTANRAAGAGSLTLPRRLAPGTWRATLTAVDAAGNRSTVARVTFTIRRRAAAR